MAASAKRKQEEKHLKMLREMTSLPPNRKCFDCDQRGPTYANMTVGSFVCTSCSGILCEFPLEQHILVNLAHFNPAGIKPGTYYSRSDYEEHCVTNFHYTELAKSTLTLIPLLGVHEILFVFVTDETAVGLLRNVKLTFELLLSSFQGFIVAVLYCFANHEVQSELKKLCGGLSRKPGTSHSGSVVSFLSNSRYDTEPLNGDLQSTGRDGQACIKQTAIYP
ncbi:UNVERIFIED_CONTAM: hypothetical protein FKN15_067476 [Acipenser sinensis]